MSGDHDLTIKRLAVAAVVIAVAAIGAVPANGAVPSRQGPELRLTGKLTKAVWPCPGTGPRATSGRALADEDASLVETTSAPAGRGHRRATSTTRRWSVTLEVYADANDDAALDGFGWRWRIAAENGLGWLSATYSTAVPGAAPVPPRYASDGHPLADKATERQLIELVDRWAYREAAAWGKAAFDTWSPKHRCVSLAPSRKAIDLPPGIPVKETIGAKRTKSGKRVRQKITPQAPAGVIVRPRSAMATAGRPAVFTLVARSRGSLAGSRAEVRDADEAGGGEQLKFDGVSDDGRSLLDVTVDPNPPVATVEGYAAQQSNTGQGPGTSGQQTITEALADSSAKAYPARCARRTCELSLWVDDAVTTSGSEHRDADDENPACDESNPPSTVDQADTGATTIYLTYDENGDLAAARLLDAPNAVAVGNGRVVGGVTEGSGVEDACDTDLGSTIPYPDWVRQPLDVGALARGASLHENLVRAGSFDLGEVGTVSFDWQAQLQFSIAHAGNPPGS